MDVYITTKSSNKYLLYIYRFIDGMGLIKENEVQVMAWIPESLGLELDTFIHLERQKEKLSMGKATTTKKSVIGEAIAEYIYSTNGKTVKEDL